jgi:hypothetical protein
VTTDFRFFVGPALGDLEALEVREELGIGILLEVRVLGEEAAATIGGVVVGSGGRAATARSIRWSWDA